MEVGAAHARNLLVHGKRPLLQNLLPLVDRGNPGGVDADAAVVFDLEGIEDAGDKFAARGFDLGQGKGTAVGCQVSGGVTGIIIDARGRQPFAISTDKSERIECLTRWIKALDAYPLK